VRSLYISHNGMTEPLGHAQVLPYVVGLARRGVEVEILSFEKAGTLPSTIEGVRARLARDGIRWQPMVRSASHGLGRKAWEAGSAVVRGLVTALRRRPDIVHARSYLPAAAADVIASVSPGARLLFDVRGMLGDEAVDGGAWSRDSLRYRLVKRYERRLFHGSSALVVLTEALRDWMRENEQVPDGMRVDVVPCCVDTDAFEVAPDVRARTRAELGLGGRPVVVYAGTLGSWYKAEEMARFVGLMRGRHPDLAFLVLTQADGTELTRAARAAGLGEKDIVVRAVRPAEMPAMLAAGDVGLSFIQPCFSKTGSSPTKVGEYLAAGLPVVLNTGVGDQAALVGEPDACVVLPSFGDSDLAAGAARAADLMDRPHALRAAAARRVASARLSLNDVGIPRYYALYEAMCAAS
jgi:glycosyltransferase involved in cell wall biosynthesis